MNELSLFTGIGGGLLGGFLLGWRTVCAVEKEPYCREVLFRRQRDGLLPMFPIWDDVRTFDGKPWRGTVDVVTAGFPCQPFSVAGRRRGEQDERNLWPDTIRIIREVRPRFALLENVPGLLATRYFGRILGDISESGYDAEWDVISAADVGAPHLRKRLWILLSNTTRSRKSWLQQRRWGREGRQDQANPFHDGEKKLVANTESLQRQAFERDEPNGVLRTDVAHPTGNGREPWREGDAEKEQGRRELDRGRFSEAVVDADRSRCIEQRRTEPAQAEHEAIERVGWWEFEPDVGRVADGIPFRVDQLRGLGNAQVPAVVVRAWETLS